MPPDEDPQQHPRIISRPSCLRWLPAHEPQLIKGQILNEPVDGPHRIVLIEIFIQGARKQHALSSCRTVDIAHRPSRKPILSTLVSPFYRFHSHSCDNLSSF